MLLPALIEPSVWLKAVASARERRVTPSEGGEAVTFGLGEFE